MYSIKLLLEYESYGLHFFSSYYILKKTSSPSAYEDLRFNMQQLATYYPPDHIKSYITAPTSYISSSLTLGNNIDVGALELGYVQRS